MELPSVCSEAVYIPLWDRFIETSKLWSSFKGNIFYTENSFLRFLIYCGTSWSCVWRDGEQSSHEALKITLSMRDSFGRKNLQIKGASLSYLLFGVQRRGWTNYTRSVKSAENVLCTEWVTTFEPILQPADKAHTQPTMRACENRPRRVWDATSQNNVIAPCLIQLLIPPLLCTDPSMCPPPVCN